VKLTFLKLLDDRELHRSHTIDATSDSITVPIADVRFSRRWIEGREKDHPSRLDALQFQVLLQGLEAEIQTGRRKRIFDENDHIRLSAETIKGVVQRLEHTGLFRINVDWNGRLFETFLNATMRGKDLGQYFTPRSVVRLAVRLARLRADRAHIDTVVDACCGTGGFMIDALLELWSHIDMNPSLSDFEKKQLKDETANVRICGIDIAREPALARIARMNMYLHNDGGSRIYQADSLDNNLADVETDSAELKRGKHELRNHLARGEYADVIVTNPPFAKEYQRQFVRDERVLDDYTLAFDKIGGSRKPKSALRSSVMFLER